MTDLELYVTSHFGIVQPDEMTIIGSLFHFTTIKKGEFFQKSGCNCDKLGFIQNGLLRIYTIEKGKEVTQWISSKGYFITDISSFVLDTPAKWTIQALVNTEIYVIDKKTYNKLDHLVPQWAKLEKNFIVKCFAIMEDRIQSHLSMSAEERYQKFYNNNRLLFNQVPLQYIASILGMTPETFSRIRKKINS